MERKTGISALAYTGVQARTPPEWVTNARAPLTSDYKDYFVGTFWFLPSTKDLWFLANKDNNQGEWVQLTGIIAGGIQTLTGDIGLAVGPDGADNIDVIGTAGQCLVTGVPASNRLTISLDDSIATSYVADDANSAVPVANVLNVFGDGVLTATSAAGNTLTVGLASSVGNDGEVIIGATGGLPAWNNITSLDTSITITNGPNTIDLSASAGPPYSAGTFTPILSFGGASVGISYNRQQAYYTRVGNRCIIYVEIELTSKGSSVGAAKIEGLPFSSTVAEVDLYGVPLRGITFGAGRNLMHGNIASIGVTEMELIQASYTGGTVAVLTNTNFLNTAWIQFDGSYII